MIKSILEEITNKPVSSITVAAIIGMAWLGHFILTEHLTNISGSVQDINTSVATLNERMSKADTDILLLNTRFDALEASLNLRLNNIDKTLEERNRGALVVLEDMKKQIHALREKQYKKQ